MKFFSFFYSKHKMIFHQTAALFYKSGAKMDRSQVVLRSLETLTRVSENVFDN